MNQLKNSLSQYLLQHAENPVHWQVYGEEAFSLAKKQNRPIFISVGYSSCHWCHVMAEESFENKRIAEILNNNFVNIKIDKEEFPEVDTYYQKACSIFTGGGGWPLSGFLTPDGDPIFVGTYFPAESTNQQIPTFPQLISEISTAYKNDEHGVKKSAKEVSEQIQQPREVTENIKFDGHFPHPSIILNAIKQFEDKDNGGYGEAPKFPQFSFYEWAIEHIAQGNVGEEAAKHIVYTLEKILCGGIYDHARGGIHRYSVDKNWLIPHFEKMLYDQAGLLKLLAKFSIIHPSPLVYDGIFNTLLYLEKEMLGNDNYFLTSQDADSEGQEGLYFTFTHDEFDDIINQETLGLSLEELELVRKWFPIEKDGNFDMGLNVIFLNHQFLPEMFQQENWELVRKIKKSLLENRSNRIPPKTDHKGISGQNFLLLTSLCEVIQYVSIPQIKIQASTLLKKTLEPILKTFTRINNQKTELIHSTTNKEKSNLFEDYVYFAELMLRSYEVSGNNTFKQNLRNVLTMIGTEFFKDGIFYTTKLNSASHTPNIEFDLFDQSYQSALATLIKVARRSRILFLDNTILAMIDENYLKDLKNKVLQNPIYHGEALQALSYPDHLYQKLSVPKKWQSEQKFLSFVEKIMSRIVLDYQENETDWNLCHFQQCLSQGKDLNDLFEKLMANKNSNEK